MNMGWHQSESAFFKKLSLLSPLGGLLVLCGRLCSDLKTYEVHGAADCMCVICSAEGVPHVEIRQHVASFA